MKAEGETGFEPDLLIETYKVSMSEVLTDKKAKKKAKGFVNRCVIIKDRSDTINGQVFDKPKFKDFSSVIKFLNLGGTHIGSDPTRNSEALIGDPDHSVSERKKQVEIALEELKDLLIKCDLDGRAAETQKNVLPVLKSISVSHRQHISRDWLRNAIRDGINGIKSEFGLAVPQPAVVANPEKEEHF